MNPLLNGLSQFFVFSFGAIFVENTLFARGLEISALLRAVNKGSNLLQFGAILTLNTTLASLTAFMLYSISKEFSVALIPAIQPLLYILMLGLIYMALHSLLRETVKKYRKIERSLALATFNTGVLGTMLLVSLKNLTLVQSVGFGLGTGIGYTLALLLVGEGNRKMKNKAVPKAFKGLPAMLLYLGILAMAIYGFAGYQVQY